MRELSINYSTTSIIWPRANNVWRKLGVCLSGFLLLACASQISIPLEPVPLTFQSATVILIGMLYGANYGAVIVLSYLAAGALGMPVFANFSFGIDKFFGPTGGYLLGFLPAVYLSGFLAQRGFSKNIFRSFFAALLGVSVIFGFGLLQLAQLSNWQYALTFGLAPFVYSESFKLIAIACITPRFWRQK